VTSDADGRTRSNGSPRGWWKRNRPLLLSALLLVAALDVYAVWFVGAEQTLYHADQVTYWSYSQQLSRLLVSDPAAALRAVGHSIANNDVNLLPALPMAFIMALFGSSRLVYVLAILTVYGGATIVMLGVALRRFGIAQPAWLTLLVFLLVPTIWRPVFIGYLGLGGVALALAVLALVVPVRSSPHPVREMASAGALLAVLVLFRRWWGIWALSFCVVVLLEALWELIRSRPMSLRKFREIVTGPIVLGAAAGGTLVVFAAPIIVQRLTTDYADRFAAYSLQGASQRIAAVGDHVGLLGPLLVVGSALLLLARPVFRRAAVLLVALMAVTYALMVSIQDHSPHHWWLYDPAILLLVGLAVGGVLETLSLRGRQLVVAMLVVVGGLFTAAVFVPGFAVRQAGGLFPRDRVRPLVRHDLAEVDRLLTYLDHRYQNGSGTVYVIASSPLLSDQVLGFANLSLGTDHPSVRGFLASSHVDRRDGFPRGLLVADAVVVADPVQLHLRAEEQRVVVEAAHSFLDGTDIARAFRELPVTFTLDHGVRVLVFERVRPTTADDIEGFSARLQAAYPDRPEIFAP